MKKFYFFISLFLFNNLLSFFDSDFFDDSILRINQELREIENYQRNLTDQIFYKNGSVTSTRSYPIHFKYVENINGISIFCYFPEFINEKDLVVFFENESLFIKSEKEGFFFQVILKKDKYLIKSILNLQTKDESRNKYATSSVGQNIQQSNSFSKIVDLKKVELSFNRSENFLIIDVPYSEINEKFNTEIPIKIIGENKKNA